MNHSASGTQLENTKKVEFESLMDTLKRQKEMVSYHLVFWSS